MRSPSVVVKLIKAGHLAQRLLRYISKKAINMTADLGFGVMPFQQNQISWAIEILRGFQGNSRASEVRHVVLSLPKGIVGKEAEALLRSLWSDWVKTYAPDRAWVFVIQYHNGVLHAHGAVQNVGPNVRPLKLRPHKVKEMSEVKFSYLAIIAKGIGKKGITIYTRPRKKLVVQELAELLVMPGGDIDDCKWNALEKAAVVKEVRSRKDGTPVSFEFLGRRIRFKTLRHFMLTQHNPQPQHNMPTQPIQSTKPLSASLVESLKSAGFSAKDLESLSQNLHVAALSQAEVTEPKKALEQTPLPLK